MSNMRVPDEKADKGSPTATRGQTQMESLIKEYTSRFSNLKEMRDWAAQPEIPDYIPPKPRNWHTRTAGGEEEVVRIPDYIPPKPRRYGTHTARPSREEEDVKIPHYIPPNLRQYCTPTASQEELASQIPKYIPPKPRNWHTATTSQEELALQIPKYITPEPLNWHTATISQEELALQIPKYIPPKPRNRHTATATSESQPVDSYRVNNGGHTTTSSSISLEDRMAKATIFRPMTRPPTRNGTPASQIPTTNVPLAKSAPKNKIDGPVPARVPESPSESRPQKNEIQQSPSVVKDEGLPVQRATPAKTGRQTSPSLEPASIERKTPDPIALEEPTAKKSPSEKAQSEGLRSDPDDEPDFSMFYSNLEDDLDFIMVESDIPGGRSYLDEDDWLVVHEDDGF